MLQTRPGGTREQEAAILFEDRCASVRTRLAASSSIAPTLGNCFDVWRDAATLFGQCELNARALDRATALDVFEERWPRLKRVAEERNVAGMDRLETIRVLLPQLENELSKVDIPADELAAILTTSRQSFREEIADWEMKGVDAERLMAVVDEVYDGLEGGLTGLVGLLEKKLDESAKVRRSKDRGTRENWPVWKLVFAALAIGIAVTGAIISSIVHATTQNGNVAIALNISFWLVGLFFALASLFC